MNGEHIGAGEAVTILLRIDSEITKSSIRQCERGIRSRQLTIDLDLTTNNCSWRCFLTPAEN
jgi:hypothetical protein